MDKYNWNELKIIGKNSTVMKASNTQFKWPIKTFPTICSAGHFPLSAHAFRFAHQSPTHALHLHEYDGIIDMDGRKRSLQPGTVTISPANGITRYDLPLPGRHWCIHFHAQPLRQPLVSLPLYVNMGEAQSGFADRIAHIAQLHAVSSQSDIARTAASLAFQELLLLLAYKQQHTMPTHNHLPSEQAVDQLLQVIHRNLDQPLRVSELAEEVQISQNYLASCFRKRMGMTIPRYILQARIKRAKLLLGTTDLPVKQIAAHVGMPDPHHFNKQFHRLTGISPSSFRRSNVI